MKIRIVLLGLLIAAGMSMNVKASGDVSRAEAMFIYNFLRHINWPETSSNTFVIGIYGNSEVYDQLQIIAKNRKVGTRPISIRKIASPQDAGTCQLLFVPGYQIKNLNSLSSQLGNASCLVVGEKEGSNSKGSTIEFLVQDNKLKFRINEERAHQQNLAFSRALLDMAI